MPVNPANQQFAQSGPRAVAPAVVYNQQPQNMGFYQSVVPGLLNLAQLAQGLKGMVEGDPLKDAQGRYYDAFVDKTKADLESQKDKDVTGAITSWRTILQAMPGGDQRTSSEAAAVEDLMRYNLTEQEARTALSGANMLRPEERAKDTVYRAAGLENPAYASGQAPPWGAQGSSPATGPGVDSAGQQQLQAQQTQQASTPLPDPRAMAGEMGAFQQEPPVGPQDPRTAQAMQAAKESQQAIESPNRAGSPGMAPGLTKTGTPLPGAQPGLSNQAVLPQGPPPEPVIRTNFGPVPRPQREFQPPERAIVPGVGPNDILPLAEANANPTYNAAVAQVVQEQAPRVANLVDAMMSYRVEMAHAGKPFADQDALLGMKLTELQIRQYLAAGQERLGIIDPEAANFEKIVELTSLMTTQGRGWSPERVQALTAYYKEHPEVLKHHGEMASGLAKIGVDFETLAAQRYSADVELQGRRETNQANLQVAGINAQVNLARTQMLDAKWRAEYGQKDFELRMSLLNNSVDNLNKKDTRIGELLRSLNEQGGLSPEFKERIQAAMGITQGFKAVQSQIQDNEETIRKYEDRISTKFKSTPDEEADDMEDFERAKVRQKKQLRENIDRLEEENESLRRMTQGKDGLPQMTYDALRELRNLPEYKAAQGTPEGSKVITIVNQLETLARERGGLQSQVDALQDPEAFRGQLDTLGRNWLATPPTFAQFKNLQINGYPIGDMLRQDPDQLATFYAYFRESIAFYRAKREGKKYRRQDPRSGSYPGAGGTGSRGNTPAGGADDTEDDDEE